MKIKRGTLIKIKPNWEDEGKVGVALGVPVLTKQWWVPVLWADAEDPDFTKLASVEVYVVKLPAQV